MPAQALVTGAGGFIGSHLVEALVRSGARVRLGSIARTTSKPLLPVQGVAVIERMIGRLHEAGVAHCTVVTCHLAEVIEA